MTVRSRIAVGRYFFDYHCDNCGSKFAAGADEDTAEAEVGKAHYCRDCERDTMPCPPPTVRDREERCDTET